MNYPNIKKGIVLSFLIFLLIFLQGYAKEPVSNKNQKIVKDKKNSPVKPHIVNLFNDTKGWKLKVNGKDFYVKGVVYGYTPVGENYSYNLWEFSDDFIKKVLDKDCKLMQKANVNAIRLFSTIPPKWVTYIYKQYGIMTVINHHAGRYGITVNGAWKEKTDYSDPVIRKIIKNEILELVKKYKDVPGILMYALGNENNYGLEWKSFEIENLPTKERHKAKAKYLYTLYNEIIKDCKKIDSNHPYSIVNGDIQYIDLISKYCQEIDILGSNVYRGISFTNLWEEVKKKLNKPVLFTEFGCDAYNAIEGMEDQKSQAKYLKGQWQEMYNKSYGKGEEGNSIGGLVFQWRDEWWKYGQTDNLDKHDLIASWSNGGYAFDFQKGQNNMNEEWLGITSIGKPDEDGIYDSDPRVAYYILSKIWTFDLYNSNKEKINKDFDDIDIDLYSMAGDIRMLKKFKLGYEAFRFDGAKIALEMVFGGDQDELDAHGKDGMYFTHGQMLFLNFAFHPFKNLQGTFSLNILGNVAEKEMEFAYGQRGKKYYALTTTPNAGGFVGKTINGFKEIKDHERIRLYHFESTFTNKYFDFEAFYHVPRFHWGYEGDFYGLLRETTNIDSIDLYDGSAPFGFQFNGKKNVFLKGLTVLVGPEIYWGANPKIMVRYMYDFNYLDFAIIHSEDFVTKKESTAGTAIEKASRQTTLYLRTKMIPYTTWEVGLIMSGTEKIGDTFVYTTESNSGTGLQAQNNKWYIATRDSVRFTDTLGAKTKFTFDILNRVKLDVGFSYAGIVADGGAHLREAGTMMPYSELGNKMVADAGLTVFSGKIIFSLRGMYRWNIIEANPKINATIVGSTFTPGVEPRNRQDDPFAVLDNRECLSGEMILTFDPTPATYFYHWDNDNREDARFAFNLGINYVYYPTITDSYTYYHRELQRSMGYGFGYPTEDTVWKAMSKLVFNPTRTLKMIYKLEAGFQLSNGFPGTPYKLGKYYSLNYDFIIFKRYFIKGFLKKDAWGPYDYYREFNITYPWQWMIDFCVLIDRMMDYKLSSKIGIKYNHRMINKYSPPDEYKNGGNKYMFEITTYYVFSF